MNYFLVKDGGYIVGVGTTKNTVCNPISKVEAEKIRNELVHRPIAPEGYGYRLKTDLTWELYELLEPEADPELTAEEALDIIMGGSV